MDQESREMFGKVLEKLDHQDGMFGKVLEKLGQHDERLDRKSVV